MTTADNLVSLDDERAYVACTLIDGGVSVDLVEPADVYASDLRLVLEAAQRVAGTGSTPDETTTRIELERMGRLAHVGGVEFLTALTETVPPIWRASDLGYRVRELAAARRARDAHRKIAGAFDRGDIEDARKLEAKLLADARPPVRHQARTLGDMAWRLITSWTDESPSLCTLGLPELDDVFGGMERPSLFVVGADSGVGKSWLALTLAIGMAQAGERPGIVSLEDAERLWSARALGAATGIPSGVLRRGTRDPWTIRKCTEGAARLADLGVHFVDPIACSADDAASAMTHLVRERGCTVLIADYLQAAEDESARDLRHGTDKNLARMKRASASLGVPLVLFSQLNRVDESERWKEPSIKRLKETGSIEIRSDGVLMAWRSEAPPPRPQIDNRSLFCRAAKAKGETSAGTLLEFTRAPGGLWEGEIGRAAREQQELFPEAAQ